MRDVNSRTTSASSTMRMRSGVLSCLVPAPVRPCATVALFIRPSSKPSYVSKSDRTLGVTLALSPLLPYAEIHDGKEKTLVTLVRFHLKPGIRLVVGRHEYPWVQHTRPPARSAPCRLSAWISGPESSQFESKGIQ